MSLDESLEKLREMSKQRYGEERVVMLGAIKEQRESGVLDRCIQVGDTLPSFALPDHENKLVKSEDLLAQGAVVLTVFRGHW